MCRWVAYLGGPVYLEDFLCAPAHSLIAQSRHSREGKSEINADGFGVGWFAERSRPGLFRSIYPAWSDENLISLAHQIRSPLFLAHVRASTGTSTTRANCHPFAIGSWIFMHNGQIGDFERHRRPLEALVPDDLYAERRGTTDSELVFLKLLSNAPELDPKRAVVAVIEAIEAVIGASRLSLTAAFSNGEALYAVRYASDGRPPSLYTRALGDRTGYLVVSEALDEVSSDWLAVPPQSFLKVSADGVVTEPIRLAS